MADVQEEGATGEVKMPQPGDVEMPQPDTVGGGEPEPLAVVDLDTAPAAQVPTTPRYSTRKRTTPEPQTQSQQKRPRGRPPKKPRGRPPKTRSAAAAEAEAEAEADDVDIGDEAAEDVGAPVAGSPEAETGGQAEVAGPSTVLQVRNLAKKVSGLENRMRLQELAMEQVLGSQKLAAAQNLEVAVKELTSSISKAVQDFNKKLRQ